MMHRASHLRAFLQELGVDARKSLSQHFLIDGNILRKIVATAQVQTGDHILEIGPGPGALTELLLEKGAHVLAVEIDPTFAQALHRLQTNDHTLEILQEDFLKLPLEQLLSQKPKWKVVANLPYHITTPILTKLLPLHPFIQSITIMVQKEYAKRMVSLPPSSDYSSLSLFVQFYSHPKSCFTISPTCFYPPPKVQSAVVHCQLHPPPSISSTQQFFLLTRHAFQKKRKTLRASLKDLYPTPKILQALSQLGLTPDARPQELSLDQFLLLYKLLTP
jgi:16S rRNA (adenine1518-N6/adenine1519-N6)-dimethyltransferase